MTHTVTRTEQLDPRTLLVDVNVRAGVQLDKQFVATIKDHGVLVPIVAVDTPDGVRVRFGHRRTLAAVEAGLDTVPVLIVDPQSGDPESDAAQIDRLVTQHVENTHRAGLSTTDEVEVAKQLTAFGLTPGQIARRTRTKKAHVEQTVAVANSELAAKATARYDLTLDQAAVQGRPDLGCRERRHRRLGRQRQRGQAHRAAVLVAAAGPSLRFATATVRKAQRTTTADQADDVAAAE